MYSECPFANAECKYYGRSPVVEGSDNGCYADTDHIVPKRLAQTTLASLFINSPDNKQQLCRLEHDEKTIAGDEPLPTRTDMIESLQRQMAEGAMHLGKKQRKVIGI